MNVYFDNAATTPDAKEVIDSISSVMNDSFGNHLLLMHLEEMQKNMLKLQEE